MIQTKLLLVATIRRCHSCHHCQPRAAPQSGDKDTWRNVDMLQVLHAKDKEHLLKAWHRSCLCWYFMEALKPEGLTKKVTSAVSGGLSL